jgi:methylphosphotriester-DNA--protein-cysteine methyltransferase
MNTDRPRQPSAGHVPQKNKTPAGASSKTREKVEIDSDAQEMLTQMKVQKQEMENEMKRLLENAKMSKSEFSRFLKDKKNFTPQEWEQVEKMRTQFLKEFQSLTGKEGAEILEKKTTDKATKAKKGKSLAARKKWIPM